jgi:hypothetical protein
LDKLKFFIVALGCATYSLSMANSYTPEQIRSLVKKPGGPERLIAEIASNTAKMSGQMIDDQTQLTGAVAQQRTVVLFLRTVNYEKKDIQNLVSFRQIVASKLAPSVCTAPIASVLINEYQAEYKYIAYSKSREYLFEYAFNRTTCNRGYRW